MINKIDMKNNCDYLKILRSRALFLLAFLFLYGQNFLARLKLSKVNGTSLFSNELKGLLSNEIFAIKLMLIKNGYEENHIEYKITLKDCCKAELILPTYKKENK